ncbi:hypothetical protein HDU89_000966 [Geranomyces variabilis]|nr:hypothetical protein HDU89_000966 [Geranomyces variabilis]
MEIEKAKVPKEYVVKIKDKTPLGYPRKYHSCLIAGSSRSGKTTCMVHILDKIAKAYKTVIVFSPSIKDPTWTALKRHDNILFLSIVSNHILHEIFERQKKAHTADKENSLLIKLSDSPQLVDEIKKALDEDAILKSLLGSALRNVWTELAEDLVKYIVEKKLGETAPVKKPRKPRTTRPKGKAVLEEITEDVVRKGRVPKSNLLPVPPILSSDAIKRGTRAQPVEDVVADDEAPVNTFVQQTAAAEHIAPRRSLRVQNQEQDEEPEYEINHIVDRRGKKRMYYKVNYVGYDSSYDEWRPARELERLAPEAVAEYNRLHPD